MKWHAELYLKETDSRETWLSGDSGTVWTYLCEKKRERGMKSVKSQRVPLVRKIKEMCIFCICERVSASVCVLVHGNTMRIFFEN